MIVIVMIMPKLLIVMVMVVVVMLNIWQRSRQEMIVFVMALRSLTSDHLDTVSEMHGFAVVEL